MHAPHTGPELSRITEPPGKNKFGSRQILSAVNGNFRDNKQLVWWEGERDEVRSLAVTFSIEPPASVIGARMQATLIVDWGGEGGLLSAEIDMVRGGVLIVQGSYIRVSARNDSEDTFGNTAAEIAVSAALAFSGSGSKPTTIHPTRSFFESDLAVNSPVNVLIPAFAKSVDFIRNNFLTSSFTAQFQDASGAGFIGGVQVPAGAQLGRELQVPQGARVLVLNDVGGFTHRIITQFGLDL